MIYKIPNVGDLELKTIILDLNGTLAVNGKIVEGVAERINSLKELGFNIILLTGDTNKNADEIAKNLNIEWKYAETGIEKKDIALGMSPESCVSIGNGLIDLELMKVVKLRIVTLQDEGVHVKTLLNSDIVVPSINNALDLFIKPSSLIATLRK